MRFTVMYTNPVPTLKLPRQVELDPRNEDIKKLLAEDLRPLWENGKIKVPHVPFGPTFEAALKFALISKHLDRGLEQIESILNAQQKGLDIRHESEGTSPAYRLCRLLIIPNGCTERFYRTCEAILFRHEDRVLGLRVNVSYEQFALSLFGEGALIKVLLVSDRGSATNVLFALVE